MPLYERIADSIARHITAGTLAIGERLPSVRRLSAQNKVSVSTAVQVYMTLEKRGLVDARPKSGFFVRPATRHLAAELRCSRPAPRATKVGIGELRTRIFELSGESDIVPLGAATPCSALLPVAQLNRVMAGAVRRAGAKAIAYAPLTGCESLRRQLARRSLEWGCQVAAEDVIVTGGTTEALSLCLRATAKPGEIVVLESPTYFGILQAVETLGLRALEVPTHPETGMDLDRLEGLLHSQQVAVVLAIPSFNNPLGSCMPEANRRRLVAMLARKEVPLIEDDIYGDLAFPPAVRACTAKGFDEKGLVLLCGSVSKTLAPGWRVGWVVPGPRYYDTIKQLKFGSTLASPSAPQLALADFLRDGGYDRHLRLLRRAYAEQVARMAHAIAETFPAGVRISRPQGGFVLWVELPGNIDAVELQARAIAERISISPGPAFSAKPKQFSNFIRISCGQPWSVRIERAVSVLGLLVRQLAREGASK
jgi:DNA-binding transcriptional MocR family regulator